MKGSPGLGGVRLAFLGVVLLLVVFIAGYALAAEFSSSASPDGFEATDSDVELNFTVNNTDSSENITVVNITLPGGFVFVQDSNKTSADSSLWNFSNGTDYITWENATDEGFILLSDTEWFNATFSPATAPGNYTFNVSIEHTNGELNYTDVNVTVNDTTAPTNIIPITGENPENDTWINTSSVYINFTFTELNPHTCTYDNMTDNQTESPDGNNCSFNITGYNEGNWTYRVWVNDTSDHLNVSDNYTIKYDSTDPDLNSLGLFYQGENVSGENITSREDVVISLNMTDALSGVDANAVWANVYNKSGGLVVSINLSAANGDFNGTWDTATYNNGSEVYTVEVNGTDKAGNTPDPGLTITLELLGAPDLTVTDVEWTSSNSNAGWPTSSDDITLNITIMNIGDANFTGTFNVTTDIDGSEENRSTLDYLNESEYVVHNVTLNASDFSTNKYYTFTIEVDPENVVNESTETNNTYVFGFNLGYNISLVGIDNGTVNFTSPDVAKAFPDSNITVNISVTGGNGTGVTSLSESNFVIWSRWGSNDFNTSDRVYNFDSGVGDGYYTFTFKTQELYNQSNKTMARFGDNYLNVSAVYGSYSGRGLLLYNITAPDLTVYIDIDDIDLAGSDYKTVDVNLTITNNGNAPAVGIWVDNSNWEYVSVFDVDADPNNLTLSELNPGDSYIFPGAGNDLELTTTGTQSGSDYNLFVFVNYYDSVGNGYQGFDKDKVDVDDSGSGNGDNGNGATPGGGDLELELTLMDWDDEIDGYPGGSNTTRVDVKNTGDVTVVAKVSFTCDVVEGSPTIAPVSKSLAIGASQEFIIDFNIKDDAEIGEYDCTVKAYVSSSEDDYDTEVVVLRVLATEEVAAEINQSCQNLSATIEGLFDRFSMINKALVNDTNLSRVENLLNTANSTLQDIWNAIAGGDYITAHDLIESLNTSLGSIEDGLDDLELEQTLGGGLALSGTWFWAIIIIVVVIAVAFVAYLFFPQKGYGPKKSITDTLKDTIRIGASRAGEIKEKGKALGSVGKKEPFRPSGYVKGYEKQPTTAYGYRKGPAGKIKGAFSRLKEKLKRKKKPQKEVTQYFKSSASNIINYS